MAGRKITIKKMLICFFLLIFAAPSWAAWTVSATLDKSFKLGDGRYIQQVKIEAISDGSDLAEFEIDTYLTDRDMKRIEGGVFYQVITDPGTEPDATWAVSFDDELGASILDLTGLSVSATQIHDVSTDLGNGFYPIVTNIGVDIGDIGSESDSVTIYLLIVK